MDDLTIARVVHVVAVLMWIGGVAFVTTVAMPAIRRQYDAPTRLSAFHGLESGFSWQAKIWVLLAGASGFWMTWRADMWSRFTETQYWWMWAMLLVWGLFMVILFVAEPLVIHPILQREGRDGRWHRRLQTLHYVLSVLGLLTIAGAVAGAHGWMP